MEILILVIIFFMLMFLVEKSDRIIEPKHYDKICEKLHDYELYKKVLFHDELPIIGKLGYNFFFKYYISNTGLVFRWSKLSKEIKKRFKELEPVKEEPINYIHKFYE